MEQDISLMELYLTDLSNIKKLSETEEKELFYQYKNGNLSVKDRLIENNLKLVISVAKKYIEKGLELADLISHGNLGLINAVEKYDVTKNVKFSTYAYHCIEDHIIRGISNEKRTIRLPIWIQSELHKYYEVRSNLRQKLQYEPSIKEIAEGLKTTQERVEFLSLAEREVFSLDFHFNNEEEDNNDEIITLENEDSAEEEYLKIDNDNEVRKIIKEAELTDIEKKVINLRYGFNGNDCLVYTEIGKILDKTHESIRMIEKRALIKMSWTARALSLAESKTQLEGINKNRNKKYMRRKIK